MKIFSEISQAKKLIAIQFLVGSVFWYGIEKTFVKDELGFGAIGISMVVATYLIVTLVLEVPSGILADKWGRKNVLISSLVLFIAANIVLGASQDMGMYLIGTVLWGLFSVTISGTMESMTYDTLLAEGKAAMFQKVDAFQSIAFMVGIFISSSLSGFIGPEFGLRSTYFGSIVPLLIALLIIITLHEPKLHTEANSKKIVAHAKEAFSLILRDRLLTRVAVLLGVVFLMQNLLYEYSQYYYLELFDDNVTIAAILSGASGLFLALGYAVAAKINRFQLMLLCAGVAMAVSGLWVSGWAVVIFFLVYPFAAIIENRSQTALQHGLKSDVRATSTSVVNFLSSCVIIPLSFGFAWIIEQAGAQFAYLIAGVFFMCVGVLFALIRLSTHGGIREPIIAPDVVAKV